MSDRTIDQADRDTNVTGVELVPVSDGGAAKAVSVEQIKDYVMSKISGVDSSDSADLDNDGIYLLKDGSIRKLSAKTLAQEVLDYGFGLAGVIGIDGNEIIGVKDANVKKTITVDGLAEYIHGRIGDITLNIESFNAADVASGADLLVVSQAGTEKKISLTNIRKFALDGLYAYADEKLDVIGDNDYVFIYSGSTVKRIKKSAFGGKGDVVAPITTTEGKIPTWGSAEKTLNDGLSVTTTVDSTSTDREVPTANAVNSAINSAVSGIDAVTCDVDNPTLGNIPQWNGYGKNLVDGKSVVSFVRANGFASDDAIPTEGAVRAAIELSSSGGGNQESYDVFDGATQQTAGGSGLVPAPRAGDNNKFLRGDGTWAEAGGGDGGGGGGGGVTSYYDTMFIPAGLMTPSKTNGAVADTVSIGLGSSVRTNDVIVFSGGTTEYAEFCFDIPDDFDGSEGMKIKLFWSSMSESAEIDSSVSFMVAPTLADDGSGIGSGPFPFAWQTATDAFNGTGSLHITDAVDVNPSGFSGTYLRIIITRDSTDSLAGDALLLGAKIQFKRTMMGEAW